MKKLFIAEILFTLLAASQNANACLETQAIEEAIAAAEPIAKRCYGPDTQITGCEQAPRITSAVGGLILNCYANQSVIQVHVLENCQAIVTSNCN
jgi:hypothetical protein